jgi:hypothetical protein
LRSRKGSKRRLSKRQPRMPGLKLKKLKERRGKLKRPSKRRLSLRSF